MQQKSELPEGWKSVSLGELVQPSKEKIEPSENPNLKYVGLEHIESHKCQIKGYGFSVDIKSTKTMFHRGDVLYGKLRPYLNKVCVTNFDGVCSTDILVFNATSNLNNYYLMRFLSTPNVVDYASNNSSGVQLPRINFQKLSSYTVPLPPLSEQHRIVLAIEALFARLDSTKEKLDRVPEILKKFRESVLAAACDGRLTEEWREEYVNKEEISIFFESIKKKRMEYWEKENLEKFVSNGKMSQNDKWKQKYKAPENTQNFDSFTLPDEWISVTIEQIASKVTDGDHNPPKRVEKGVPHLTARNIKNWEVTFDNCTYISPDDFEIVKTRYNPQKDDLIITCVGTIGETAIVSDNLVFSADRNLAAIRLTENGANPRFVQYILNAPVWRDIMKKGSGSTAQPHLYLKDIRALTIPLPPLSEQQEIVRRIAALFSFADSIEAKVAAAREKTEKLRQSILAKAFSGELVETEAEIARREGRGYETAEVLIERIKEERGKGGKKR